MSESRALLAVVILTLNEEQNLPKALASIGGQVPVVVIDSESTDATAAIAKEHGAEFIVNRFVDYATQRNFALAQVQDRFRWIFFLDADEEFTPALLDEVRRTCEADAVDGAYVRWDVRMLGYRLKHGSFVGSEFLRLMRPELARFTRAINERVDDRAMRTSSLTSLLVHHDARSLAEWFTKHVAYARKEARAYFEDAERGDGLAGFGLRTKAARTIGMRWAYNRMPLFVRPFMLGVRAVVVQGAWLDGAPGLIHAGMHALWYPMVIDLLIFEEKLRRRGLLHRGAKPG